jgi:DNA-binding transcriptional MerR regulator
MTNAAVREARTPNRFIPIAILARRVGVTPRTLRHYQDQGLVRSHRVAHNARAYDPGAVATIEIIVALRDVDLPISTIREILTLRERPSALADALRVALSETYAEKQRQISRIDTMMQALVALEPNAPAPLVEAAAVEPWRLTRTLPGEDAMAYGDSE